MKIDLFSDGPVIVRVNIYIRSISRIDDVAMVSRLKHKSKI